MQAQADALFSLLDVINEALVTTRDKEVSRHTHCRQLGSVKAYDSYGLREGRQWHMLGFAHLLVGDTLSCVGPDHLVGGSYRPSVIGRTGDFHDLYFLIACVHVRV